MAKILYANGTEKEVEPKNGTDFKLEEMQAVVGGYIELVYLPNDELMVCNEEGWLIPLELNKNATKYIKKVCGRDEPIAGNVLICKDNEIT